MYPGVQKMLDKLAKTNIIHKNKAANLKSKIRLLTLANLLKQSLKLKDKIGRIFNSGLLSFMRFIKHKQYILQTLHLKEAQILAPRKTESEESEAFMKDLEEDRT